MGINNLLLPLFGLFIDKVNHAHWMSSMAGLLFLTVIPIFCLLPYLSILQITIVKLWIIIIGVAFVTPLYALLFQMLQGEEKYLITGIGYSIGTDLLGRNIPVICLSLWYSTNELWAPASYLAFISFLTMLVLIIEIKKKN
jgi:hypothetical protein